MLLYYCRLPSKLLLEWPNGDEVVQNTKVPAGSTIGKKGMLIMVVW